MTRTIADLGSHVASRYSYQSKFANVNGWRMHYIDEGPPTAPPVLLLHGNPTWGYLWRDTMPPLLAAGYRARPDQTRPDQTKSALACQSIRTAPALTAWITTQRIS